MVEKQKTIRLSSRFLGSYRWVLYVLYIVFFGLIVISSIRVGWFYAIGQTVVYGYFLYAGIRIVKKFQQASFDEEFLYVYQKQQDYVIPLENIESVEIESLGGVYKVNLYHPEQLGKEFYFKTSLIYPLNYKSKDELVNVLRRAIANAKARRQQLPHNALMS
ncbi:MAG: hypothetical protein KF725_13195 [Cyclobacteriaceae bacterium]|nr:hypothetical protein [Cyclobacteriaceae bacterium]UYN85419.1 MAG: hypothetical protein KIT51_11020 [Cyclobacteriaceae bacterium]